jgi:hypothetical protein
MRCLSVCVEKIGAECLKKLSKTRSTEVAGWNPAPEKGRGER